MFQKKRIFFETEERLGLMIIPMNILIKTLVVTCLFALPVVAQDNEKNTGESEAKQAQQVEETKKAQEVEKVYAFLDEHFPEMRAKLDAIKKKEGEAAYEAVYSEQVEIYQHYQRTLRSGKEMAMLVIEQNKMYRDLQVLLDRYESLAADDPARVQARANAEPLLAKSNAFGGEWAKLQIVNLKKRDATRYEKQIAGLEKKVKKMDALRANPKKVFDDYIADRKALLETAKKTKEKLPEGWHTDPKEALAAAKESGKLIHVFCSATWCGPCQVMVKKVFPEKELQEALKEFEPLYLDGDVYGIFARKYHVRAFPTSIIINAEGEFLHRSNANGMSTEEFLEWLKVKN